MGRVGTWGGTGPHALPAAAGQVRCPAPPASFPASTSGSHTAPAAGPAHCSCHCVKSAVKKSNTEESPNYSFAGSPLQTPGDRWCFTFAGVALAGPRGPTCCTWTGDCLQKSTWCGIQALTTQFPKCLRYNQKSLVIPRTRKISTWMRKHNPQMLTPRWRRCWNDLTRILKQPS